MITNAAIHSISSPHHRYEDRYRLLGTGHPLAERAGRGHLFAVMDGVGGAPDGMRAAQFLADRLPAFLEDGCYPPSPTGLSTLVRDTNAEIRGWGCIPGTDRPRGAAAATVAWFDPRNRRLHLLHAGDTMAYRFDGEALQPLTREHGSGRCITRFLGQGECFRFDLIDVALLEGETLLLCTDGVTKGLEVRHLRDILVELPDPERAAAEILSRARARGSKDDITVLVVELEEW